MDLWRLVTAFSGHRANSIINGHENTKARRRTGSQRFVTACSGSFVNSGIK
jgi:hypothetical protein